MSPGNNDDDDDDNDDNDDDNDDDDDVLSPAPGDSGTTNLHSPVRKLSIIPEVSSCVICHESYQSFEKNTCLLFV